MDTTLWQIMAVGGACLLGMSIFLEAVGHEIERVEGSLRRFELALRAAYERRRGRLEAGLPAASPASGRQASAAETG